MTFKDYASPAKEAEWEDEISAPAAASGAETPFVLDGFFSADVFDALPASGAEEAFSPVAPHSGNDGASLSRPESADGASNPDHVGPQAASRPHPLAGAADLEEGFLLGLRLRKAGQVYFFPGKGLGAGLGTRVVVQLEQGTALGLVESLLPIDKAGAVDSEQIKGEVQRLATAQDIAQHTENSILAAEAAAFCKSCIRQRNLGMKLVDVEVMHDRSKIIFFFTAPARIDFRELVKDLVRNYRTRIELRQIGVRHEAQMVGAIGNCGMVCCCHSYLRKFAPVTIKMAKEQNLFLNPSKLSGMCGRLLCCLSFEQGNYEEFNRRCPKLGKRYSTPRGLFKVLRANMFSRSVVLLSEAGEEVEMSLEDWDDLRPSRVEAPPAETPRPQPRQEQGRKERPRKRGGEARRPVQHKAGADEAVRDQEYSSGALPGASAPDLDGHSGAEPGSGSGGRPGGHSEGSSGGHSEGRSDILPEE